MGTFALKLQVLSCPVWNEVWRLQEGGRSEGGEEQGRGAREGGEDERWSSTSARMTCQQVNASVCKIYLMYAVQTVKC